MLDWLNNILTMERPQLPFSVYRFGLSETEDGYLAYLAEHEMHDDEDDNWAFAIPELILGK